MHKFKPVTALLLAAAATACVTYPGNQAGADLIGGDWLVEDIAGRGVIDNARTTVTFSADGRMSGDTACNRYFADYKVSGNSLQISSAGTTRRACAPAVMDQEQRFLVVLNEVGTYRIDSTGALILSTPEGSTILARKSSAAMATISYRCSDGSALEASHPTFETAMVTHGGRTVEMEIAPSASGARYIGGGLQWWSRGASEGMLAPLTDGESIASARGIDCTA